MRSRRVVVGALVLAALAAGALLWRGDAPTAPLTVTWGDSPACVYDGGNTVNATLMVSGEVPPEDLTVTVTAYADENTSQPVGSAARTVKVEGIVVVTIPVERPPFVDIDGVTACSLATDTAS